MSACSEVTAQLAFPPSRRRVYDAIMDAVHLPPRNMVEAMLLTLAVVALPFSAGCIWLAVKWINQRRMPRQLVNVSIITLVTCAGIVGAALVFWGITASCGL